MTSQQNLRDQLTAKKLQVRDIQEKVSAIELSLNQLSRIFFNDSNKIQQKITRVQFSRPRGNPANQWPHCPMTSRVRSFYQAKEHKERELRKSKDLLKQVFDHNRAILTSKRLILENEQFDIESQIRLVLIQLHEF